MTLSYLARGLPNSTPNLTRRSESRFRANLALLQSTDLKGDKVEVSV